MGCVIQAMPLAEFGNDRLDFGTFATMDHAEQVVWPIRQTARAAVTQGDGRLLSQGAANLADLIIGNVSTSMAFAV